MGVQIPLSFFIFKNKPTRVWIHLVFDGLETENLGNKAKTKQANQQTRDMVKRASPRFDGQLLINTYMLFSKLLKVFEEMTFVMSGDFSF